MYGCMGQLIIVLERWDFIFDIIIIHIGTNFVIVLDRNKVTQIWIKLFQADFNELVLISIALTPQRILMVAAIVKSSLRSIV